MTPVSILRPVMPELNCLRGIAALSVVFYHCLFWSNDASLFRGAAKMFMASTQVGWLGVNLFFVLSGFLITGILIDLRNDARFYRTFYARRALRILPAY